MELQPGVPNPSSHRAETGIKRKILKCIPIAPENLQHAILAGKLCDRAISNVLSDLIYETSLSSIQSSSIDRLKKVCEETHSETKISDISITLSPCGRKDSNSTAVDTLKDDNWFQVHVKVAANDIPVEKIRTFYYQRQPRDELESGLNWK